MAAYNLLLPIFIMEWGRGLGYVQLGQLSCVVQHSEIRMLPIYLFMMGRGERVGDAMVSWVS